jgi:hypothetical protein
LNSPVKYHLQPFLEIIYKKRENLPEMPLKQPAGGIICLFFRKIVGLALAITCFGAILGQ